MRHSIYRWFGTNPYPGDIAIALGVMAVAVISGSLYYGDGRDWLAVLLAFPLVFRRSYPVPVLIASIVLELLVLVSGAPTITSASVLLVIYSSVVYIPDRSWGRAALFAGVAGAVILPVTRYSYDVTYAFGGMVALLAMVATAYVAGDRRRADLDFRAAELAALAERNRLVTAERDQRVQNAAAGERTRIARELHDIVAHSLAVIVVQADGGAAAAAKNPSVAVDVLRTIAETSRQALAEMRSLVGVLRSDGAIGEPDGYLPQPGLASLDKLVDQIRQSGVTVTLRLSADLPPLSPTVDLTVFRIVQEGLTNVLKHGGPAAAAEVEIAVSDGDLTVEVVDDGRGAAALSDGAGNGIQGMRERLAVLDGRLWAGPRPGGGFRLRAVVPLASWPSPTDATTRIPLGGQR
ncbi:sensor histidine kinase [Nakamurella deserti]|uniref:sensor histidine kinase n=1 Tax=Nakamurella deserti TaxID=2164074 RepID=UPI000DBE064D|nr:sensor histidine kinase [Nakamurella deserti]